MKVTVAISDLQTPFHDKRAVANVAQFIRDYKPDEVACVGDVLDAPQISRWHRSTRVEYAGKLHKDRDVAVSVLESLGVQHLVRSNHDDRLHNYLTKYAPGIADDPDFQLEKYYRLDSIGVKFHKTMYDIAPGWLMGHGDEGSMIQTPGGTAMNIAKKVGRSFIGGHTHKLGMQHFNTSYGGKVNGTLMGVEVGHLMDMRQAGYLKAGAANWNAGIAILYIDGRNVTPSLVPIHKDGSFVVEGKRWGK